MLPAGITGKILDELAAHLEAGDTVIDGGNTYYRDDIARAKKLAPKQIHYVDCGTSGGVWGLERGYCLMIGGEIPRRSSASTRSSSTIAPGKGSVEETPGRHPGGTAEEGYLHCGQAGAGHFVKMVHNGIEYGMMAAIAEGLSIIKHANAGLEDIETDAETTPLTDPEMYQYEIPVPEVAEVWRRGSVVSSWLVDLTANALAKSPELAEFAGHVSDSGEGRWTVLAAVEEGVPGPGDHRLTLPAVRVARSRRVHRQAALGHAQRVRRPRGEEAVLALRPTPWPCDGSPNSYRFPG